MYTAFQIEDIDWPNSYLEKGKLIFDSVRKELIGPLKDFVKHGKINGTKLQQKWFPLTKVDVFISHSSADKNKAIALAGFLGEFELTSFIDSYAWGYADDLLRVIDDNHSWDEKRKVYDYQTRNGTTAHVHMMLANALTQMIDRAECVIFMSSPRSISVQDSIDSVSSPWIYHELSMINLVRKKELSAYRSQKELTEATTIKKAANLPIAYNVETGAMGKITANDLKAWLKVKDRRPALDELYRIMGK